VSHLRQLLHALADPAPDPRVAHAEPGTVERELLRIVKLALDEASRDHAEAEVERLGRLASRLEALLFQQQRLESRRALADVEVRVGEALAGLSGELTDLELAEREVAETEARAAALEELSRIETAG
jgi:phage shock protein A